MSYKSPPERKLLHMRNDVNYLERKTGIGNGHSLRSKLSLQLLERYYLLFFFLNARKQP